MISGGFPLTPSFMLLFYDHSFIHILALFCCLRRKKTQDEGLEIGRSGGKSKKDRTDGAGESTWPVLQDDYMLG